LPEVNFQTLDLEERPMSKTKAYLAALALTLASSTAFAQAPPASTGCTPQERSNQALQNDQAKTGGGVICPPDVDPAMKAPAPKTGDTGMVSPPSAVIPGAQPK
jgi:hypothetical protein